MEGLETTRVPEEGQEFIQVMASFPCPFNVDVMNKPTQEKLQSMVANLEDEIRGNELYQGERPMQCNTLTYLYFLSGDMKRAIKTNHESLRLTTGYLNDVCALGNQAFLAWYSGEELSLEPLERLRSSRDYDHHYQYARAEQAYLLFRLGGKYNVSQSFKIYSEVCQEKPKNYEWKLLLALASRRLDVMNRKRREETKNILLDVKDNATDAKTKRHAIGELVNWFSDASQDWSQDNKKLIEEALHLGEDCYVVQRLCGRALRTMGDPGAIKHLEISLSLAPSSFAHHWLGICYADDKMTKSMSMSRDLCKEKAIYHFQKANELDEMHTQPLVDLLVLLKQRQDYGPCLKRCEFLGKHWALRCPNPNDYSVGIIYNIWYLLIKRSTGLPDVRMHRYISIAVCADLEQFKRSASTGDTNLLLEKILDPSKRTRIDKRENILFMLLRNCVSGLSAQQILIRLNQEGKMGDQASVEREVRKSMEEGRPHEALLLLDLASLREDNACPIVSKQLYSEILLQEIRWQLGEGLVSSKSMFQRLFTARQSNDGLFNSKRGFHLADVFILHDGPLWKPFLPSNTTERQDNAQIVRTSRVYEDLLLYLFGLGVVSNPWLSVSKREKSLPDKFADLVNESDVRLVLVLTSANTSDQFLTTVDTLLDTITQEPEQGGTTTAAAAGKPTDVAVICSGGDDVDRIQPLGLKNLGRVRQYKARQEGLVEYSGPVTIPHLQGVDILHSYFSGSLEHALEHALTFFKFLLPPE